MGNKILTIKNRSTGMVVYRLDNGRIRRELQPGEAIKVDASELEKLTYQPGGRELIQRYLLVSDEDTLNEINVHREAEYYMQEKDIIKLLKDGSLDEFLDCLDFAPQGVIDLILKYAVSLPITDINKMNALKEKTGFDVLAALKHQQEEREAEKTPEAAPAPQRRVQPQAPAKISRRAEAPKYNVVKK